MLLGRRTARTIAAAGVALALTGASACATDREVTEPEPVPVTEELLTEQLLTAEDLPAGFEAAEAQPINSDVVEEAPCDDALAEIEAEADATATFTREGLVVTNQVAYLPGSAGSFVDLIDDIYEDCAKVEIEGKSIRTLPLDFGSLTDNTKAMKVEVENGANDIDEHDYIVMQKGDLVSVIRVDGQRPNDVVVTDAAVRAAIGNLGTLDNET